MPEVKQASPDAKAAQDAIKRAAIVHSGVFHKWPTPPLLTARGRVSIAMRVSNLAIGNLRIIVRDEQHHQLLAAGVGDQVPPLSTMHRDIAWDFDPPELRAPRYLIWMIWADYANGHEMDEERSFEVEFTVRQDDMAWTSRMALTMARGQHTLPVTPNWDFIAFGTPL